MSEYNTVKIANTNGGSVDFVLLAAYFGPLIYFLHQAHGFWEMALAFLQAAVWPAYLLYHLFVSLGI